MMIAVFIITLLAVAVAIIVVMMSKEKAVSHPIIRTVLVRKDIKYGRHKVSGVSFKNLDGTSRQTIIKRCVRLADHRSERDVSFWAEWEPFNEFDPNAISVYAEETWETRGGETKEKFLGVLGYLPQELAAKIANDRQGTDKDTAIGVYEPSFGEIVNEKGKPLVGVSFNVQLEWAEFEVQDLNKEAGN